MDKAVVTEPRRPSIANMSTSFPCNADADADADCDPVAFRRLPDEIIEQILLAADPGGFASLILLNSKWRAVSQRPHLYAHHLARCPSYATSHSITQVPPADDAHLPLLRRLFVHEVKRNLFEAYLRPRKTLIKLVSNSISSSSCPGGEGMQFGSSPRGRHVLAYNSSRIYVIDVSNRSVRVERELKIQRRPVSACITNDANTLAVLSTELQVDIYDLRSSPPCRKQSLVLDNSSHAIAISSCGTVLAAAYDGGIEVSSLAAAALPADKRAVKCDAVDALAFSQDGTQILGSTVHSFPPSTVVLTAPYYDPGSRMMVDDNLSAMWTTSILFPNTSRDCSHAILLPTSDRAEPEWTFTYDRSFETFRAVRLDDLRNGTTYFTGPTPKAASQSKLLPCTLPATTTRGELVAAGFRGKDIWVYGVPEDLDAIPEPPPASRDSSANVSGLGRRNSTQSLPSRHASARGQDAEGERVPQWQVLCDKLRNNFVGGFKLTEIDGVNSVGWVGQFGGSSCKERLVVTATGVTTGPRLLTDEQAVDFVDGGRIALLDFDYGLDNGDTTEVTIEVGTDDAEPLTEERRDLETEVAIVRRRTVAQKRGGGGESNASNALLRAATAAAARAARLPPWPGGDDDGDPLVPRIVGRHPADDDVDDDDDGDDDEYDDEELASLQVQEAMDAPYAHSSPRSQTTLRRAATAAAVNRQLHPRTADGRPIEYRRADGRAEHPHESDADNWVPPPPPYQKEDPGDMPAFLRGFPIAPLSSAAEFPRPEESGRSATEVRQVAGVDGPARAAADALLPASTPSVHSVDMDDLYDVSPRASPQISLSRLVDGCTSSHAAASASRPCSRDHDSANSATAGPPSGPAASMLELDTPLASSSLRLDPTSARAPSAMMAGPVNRRPANAPTWARQAQTATDVSRQPRLDDEYPLTAAPWSNTTLDGAATAAALFPVPSSSQMASLNKRISQGNPRRLSGNVLNARLWTDPRQGASPAARSQQSCSQGLASRRPSEGRVSDADRPLIISTPTGIGGSNNDNDDKDTRRRSSVAHADTPILSPIPRRPRGNFSSVGGTAQQLENIYGSQPAPAFLHPHMLPNTPLPMWMRTPSNSSRRTANSMDRRGSRAERSAAQNMKDARLRGWKMMMTMKKKKKTTTTTNKETNKTRGSHEEQLTGAGDGDGDGWVDVPTPPLKISTKCAIM
ncbi:hypothetical protein E4U42_006487 [Claviceps africana]|uniref:F-box domain-containing protein n=1 Tax=Claviceps africana TaxID=83212 RepID=A0A8K0J4C0_9HYPO|nr:hypothetical protein E4U42_006487 [Claviceps africana]